MNDIIEDLNESLIHVQYLLANHNCSFIDVSSLKALEKLLSLNIDKLKKMHSS